MIPIIRKSPVGLWLHAPLGDKYMMAPYNSISCPWFCWWREERTYQIPYNDIPSRELSINHIEQFRSKPRLETAWITHSGTKTFDGGVGWHGMTWDHIRIINMHGHGHGHWHGWDRPKPWRVPQPLVFFSSRSAGHLTRMQTYLLTYLYG